jgi:hypothetical protein
MLINNTHLILLVLSSIASCAAIDNTNPPDPDRRNHPAIHLQRRGLSDVAMGVGDAVKDTATGMAKAVIYPVETAKNLAFAVANPKQVIQGAIKSFKEGCDEEDRDKCIGKAIGSVALFGLTRGAGYIATAAGATAKTATVITTTSSV